MTKEHTEWKQIREKTSDDFMTEIERYVQWAEENEQTQLLDIGLMENPSFFSTVIVTSENIIQLIFNRENEQITVGTASRDACEYAGNIWRERGISSST